MIRPVVELLRWVLLGDGGLLAGLGPGTRTKGPVEIGEVVLEVQVRTSSHF